MQGQLSLHPGADVPATMAALQALPGIGPWTAHYIALRALRWPDAFPAGDVALHKALGVQDHAKPQQAAEDCIAALAALAQLCGAAGLVTLGAQKVTPPPNFKPNRAEALVLIA